MVGQPSVVWAVPFTLDEHARTSAADRYSGYGDWDGASGALHPPDTTIAEGQDGTGAGRLLERTDGDGTWRVKVVTFGCGAPCVAPAAPTGLTLTPTDSSIAVTFTAPAGVVRPAAYELRYRVGAPLTDATFALGTPGDTPPPPGPAGAAEQLSVSGLKADSTVWVGVRALAACGLPSPALVASTSTLAASFTTLHGCFIATAAYGSPLAAELGPLRALRDRQLLAAPLGRLAVGAYYAFSPSLAAAIAADPRLRAATRALVGPLVELARLLAGPP
jgi:hypothetical protein